MNNENPTTESQYAPTPNYSLQPRNMRLTPRGQSHVPQSRVFPKVCGGQCEYCGVMDVNQPGDMQYKLCEHYRGKDLRCVYCPLNKDQEEVVRNSTLIVFEHPYRHGELLVRCGAYECIKAFEQEFNIKP